MLVEVKIGALIMDPNSNSPIVVLKGVDTDNILPIWVGPFEANAIALEIEKIAPQRPMTHDLLRNLIVEMDFSVSKIIISNLEDNTFFAIIELSGNNDDEVLVFDARPSDAIALALRTDCPIFVEDKVFQISDESSIETPKVTIDDDLTESAEDWPELIG